MKQRSEKEQQAYDMLQKLPRVQLTAVGNKERWGLYNVVDICIVNGIIFILLSYFGDRTVAAMRNHLNEGDITTNDMIPIRKIGRGGSPVWIASVKVVQRFEKELIPLIKYGKEKVFQDQLAFTSSSLLEHNMDGGGLNAYTMTQEEIDNAHFNYRERYRLLSEVHDEVNKSIAESLNVDKGINMNETSTNTQQNIAHEELTLQELVDRIEAMGWTVTLHRKDGATENNVSSAPIYKPTIQVPAWYNNKTYQLLSKDISSFGISHSVVKLLYSVNIKTIGQLVAMNRLDLLRINNFGGRKLREIDDVLEGLGLEYGCNLDKWHEAHKAYLASK